ncbi:DUF1273 domain-containing protein [Mangrovibacillus cuniculi]|uniref:UPF0398 protein G8O30_06615 n=1 Tax=Mangrovibacillus cuniculi TaxID=2593652 RepID=A0A7S8HFL7_9BACI|nr:DUF1273 domain-containing protein [Mangrovibacillus cuniculi]QPC46656.1 DUF1273 domain-containing protein [Mangrovibacillus cuniculi]
MKVVTITGYKPHEIGIFQQTHPAVTIIKKAIKQSLLPLCEEGLEWIVLSCQKGVEMWASQVAIELKQEYEVKLAILTPFLDQELKWKENDQLLYNEIIQNADFVDSVSKKPYENPEQFRIKDRLLIHKTDGCIILYDEEVDGSPKFFLNQCKEFSLQQDYDIRLITFEDLQLIQEEAQCTD